MKAGWEVRPLGEVCDVRRGTTITKSTTSPGNVPVIAGGIAPAYFHSTPNRPANTITVSGSGAGAGFVNFFDVPIFASDCSTVQPRDTHRVNVHYAYYFLQAKQEYIQSELKQGAAQPHVYAKDIARILIPLPPLEEQQRIVAVLDETFEGLVRARAHAEANLKNARELFENLTTQVFSEIDGDHAQTTLEEVCEFITDGTHQTPTYFGTGFLFLSAKNVKDGQLDWQDVKYIDLKQHVAMQKRLAPRVGDLLIRKNGAGYGGAALVDRELIFDVYVSLAVLRPKPWVLPEFLLQFSNSSSAQSQFKDRIKGQGVPNLHLQEIRKVQLVVPKDIKVQQEIAEKVQSVLEETRIIERQYKAKLQDLDNLRQSLLQKAFAGELT